MENNIIFDSPSSPNRFTNGMSVKFISTSDSSLDPKKTYDIASLICCSPVKSTKSNWFYPVPIRYPGVDFMQAWITEIAPAFPALDIKLVRVSCSNNGVTKDDNYSLTVNHNSAPDIYIDIELKLSKESNQHYGYTNSNNFSTGKFYCLDFLIKMFIEYCITSKKNITLKSLSPIVKSFVSLNLEQIKNKFKDGHVIRFHISTRDSYTVSTNTIIDIKSITMKNISKYLLDILTLNIDSINTTISNGIKGDKNTDKGNPYVQALYSKKTYKVEAYLAHHLIRAGLSSEFRSFIQQYFLIKKSLPNEYFWNLIFLTQFGFQIYYYYWLTHDRTFKLTTPEAFNKVTKNFQDTSSLQFFRNFFIEHSTMTQRCLQNLYVKGDFPAIAKILGMPTKIKVKESRRTKLTNLRISDHYEVLSMDEKYYHIRGDDFRMHKYLKNHFDEIKIAV